MTTNKPIVVPAGWTKVSDTVYTLTVIANTTTANNTVVITDFAGNSSTVPFAVTNIDTVAPVADFDTLVTTQASPALSGTVDDSQATVRVKVNGASFNAVVSGTQWMLPAGTISPVLAVGSYDVEVSATDIYTNAHTANFAGKLTVLANTVALASSSTNEGIELVVNEAIISVAGGSCQSGVYDYKSLSGSGVTPPQANVTILGGLSYRLSCGVQGGNATVDIALGTFYADLSLLRLYKSVDGRLQDITSQVQLRNLGNKTLLTLSLTDGGTHDEDNQANREILDPLYIGVANKNTSALATTGQAVLTAVVYALSMIVFGVLIFRRKSI